MSLRSTQLHRHPVAAQAQQITHVTKPINDAGATHPFDRATSIADTQPLALQPPQKLIHDAAVQVFSEITIFDTGIDRWVVIDLDDHHAFLGRLDVHPIQRSEEHTSELQSLMRISYAVFCLKKKKKYQKTKQIQNK